MLYNQIIEHLQNLDTSFPAALFTLILDAILTYQPKIKYL